MQSLHRCAINAIRTAIILIVAFTAVAAVWPGLPAARLYMTGHAGVCSLAESAEAVRLTSEQLSQRDIIHNRTRLIESDPHGFSRWESPLGRFWIASGSRNALEWDLAEQARRIYGKGDKGVRAGDIVLDCGANVGVYAKTALESGAKLVIAIEPAPENLECLRRNLAREIADGKVIVYPKGVWDKDDVLVLHTDPANSARDSLWPLAGAGIREVRVPLTTIDKLVAELQLPRVDYIKMDIEGAEKNAIRGAAETVRRFKPRMALCVYHLTEDPVQVPQAVRAIVPTYSVSMQGLVGNDSIIAEVAHFR